MRRKFFGGEFVEMIVGPRKFVLRPIFGGFLGLLVFVETKEDQPFVFVLRVEPLESSQGFSTGHTPRGPEIEEQRFALKGLQRCFSASKVFQSDNRKRFTDELGESPGAYGIFEGNL
jgi:hypothetical protein